MFVNGENVIVALLVLCYITCMGTETSFRRWRRQMEFTQEQAAEALGVSKSQVANWDAGVVRGKSRGERATPSLAIRCLMTNIAMDSKPTPWPE